MPTPEQLARIEAMAEGKPTTTASYGMSESDCKALTALLAERDALVVIGAAYLQTVERLKGMK
jgi:hypothetical protein